MSFNPYGINAYKNEMRTAAEKKVTDEKNVPGGRKETPFVHKPVFEKISSSEKIKEQQEEQKRKIENLKLEESNLREAKIAAKNGTWFGKRKTATSQDLKEATDKLTSGGLIMVSQPAAGEKESIYRRVAKFLVLVGMDEAARILPHLTEEQTEKIIPEIATIQKITREESAEILEEFSSLLERSREEGGLETARNILSKAYGSQKAEDILSRTLVYTNVRPFEYLGDANPDRIKVLIEGESVGVQALVLSQIGSEKAAKVINLFDVNQKKNVILRLAKMKTVSPEIIAEIDKSLHEKMLTQNTENSQNLDGKNVLAQIMKRMTPGAENGLLSVISKSDPELGEELRKRLFTEEDVIASDDRYLQNWLHNCEERDIALLIHGKSEEFRHKILSNVSKNRATVILDEEEYSAGFTKSECDRTTSMFYAALRRAWERGDLRVKGRDDDEVYV